MTNTKSTKRALITSVLALLVCVAMLVGSTFAWFTDTVTSGSNIIKSGTLDVEMYWAEGDEDPATASYKDASKGAIFNYNLWEPGYTEARHIKVANVGTLALKYQMRILANGVVSELADVIDVYYYDTATQLTRANYASGTKLGTLSEVLNNTNDNAISKKIAGNLTAKGTDGATKTVTIALHMQESAGNEYQGLAIGTDFSIQLLATQYTYEEDTFNNQYDAKADFASQEMPSAMVSALTAAERNVEIVDMGGVVLDAGYQFEPTETADQAVASKYANYHADFVVSADQLVKANSLALAGYYSAYCDVKTDGQWIAMTATEDIAANTALRLITPEPNMGDKDKQVLSVNYKELCSYGNDGTGFQCGIVGLDDSVAGTTVTVELRLYETYSEEECFEEFGFKSTNVEVGPENYITVGTFTYTFPAKEVSNQTDLNDAIANGVSAVELGAGTYKIPSDVGEKSIKIIGSGDDTVLDTTTATNVGDASITFENLKIVGKNANEMSGYGIQHTTGDIVYKNCTFENATTNEFYGNVSYIECTFKGTYYIATYSVKSATFEKCVFDRTDSRAILVYSHDDNPVKVTVKNCEFKAAAQGYTGKTEWTAAVEVDTTYIPSAGTTVTIEGCTYDSNYNGIVRDKSTAGTETAVITVDGKKVENTEIKTTGYAD